MRHKLEVPWTSRLLVTRWWYRRHSPLTSYTSSSQGDFQDDVITPLISSHIVRSGSEEESF